MTVDDGGSKQMTDDRSRSRLPGGHRIGGRRSVVAVVIGGVGGLMTAGSENISLYANKCVD